MTIRSAFHLINDESRRHHQRSASHIDSSFSSSLMGKKTFSLFICCLALAEICLFEHSRTLKKQYQQLTRYENSTAEIIGATIRKIAPKKSKKEKNFCLCCVQTVREERARNFFFVSRINFA